MKRLMSMGSEEEDKDEETDEKEKKSVFATAAGQLRSVISYNIRI
jgi:hypothetical protein